MAGSVETLFLDAGGVLVFPNWDRVAGIFTRHGLPVTGDALRRVEPHAKRSIDEAPFVARSTDADRGSRYFKAVLDAAAVPDDERRRTAIDEAYAYHMRENLWEHVPDDVVPTLEQLSAMGLNIALASNSNGLIEHLFARLGLTRFFHTICDSHVEGVEKPDPRFFEIVLGRVGGRPETTLHVGDLYHVDIVGARQAGMQALLMDPHALYEGFDVDRIRSLGELVDRVRQ